MIGWVILAAYVLGFVLLLRWNVRRMMVRLDRSVERWQYEDIKTRARNGDRGLYLLGALALTTFWPVTIPCGAAWRRFMATDLIRTPTELAERDRKELAALRTQAHDLGLPMPEVPK